MGAILSNGEDPRRKKLRLKLALYSLITIGIVGMIITLATGFPFLGLLAIAVVLITPFSIRKNSSNEEGKSARKSKEENE